MRRIVLAFAFTLLAPGVLGFAGLQERFGEDAVAPALLVVTVAALAIIGPEVHRLDPARLKRRHRAP